MNLADLKLLNASVDRSMLFLQEVVCMGLRDVCKLACVLIITWWWIFPVKVMFYLRHIIWLKQELWIEAELKL